MISNLLTFLKDIGPSNDHNIDFVGTVAAAIAIVAVLVSFELKLSKSSQI